MRVLHADKHQPRILVCKVDHVLFPEFAGYPLSDFHNTFLLLNEFELCYTRRIQTGNNSWQFHTQLISPDKYLYDIWWTEDVSHVFGTPIELDWRGKVQATQAFLTGLKDQGRSN